jgi:ABC-type multidrug transport system ATPase subunit
VGTTVITIAHRLSTVADYDKLIVMRRGRIVEQGHPWRLLEKKGLFYEMVQHSGKHAEDIVAQAKAGFKSMRRMLTKASSLQSPQLPSSSSVPLRKLAASVGLTDEVSSPDRILSSIDSTVVLASTCQLIRPLPTASYPAP